MQSLEELLADPTNGNLAKAIKLLAEKFSSNVALDIAIDEKRIKEDIYKDLNAISQRIQKLEEKVDKIIEDFKAINKFFEVLRSKFGE